MHKFFEEFLDGEKLFVRGELSAESLKVIQPHLMPENIKSAVVWLIPYYTGKHENRNVSLYAVSRDYHLYARDLKERLCSKAKEAFPNEGFYVFCDSSPVNEVAAAITAGLGVLGKNRLLINEKYGSYTRYSYTNSKNAVLIQVEDRYLVIGGIDEESTKDIYIHITEHMLP